MDIFVLIVFGLSVVRSFTIFFRDETYSSGSTLFARFAILVSMIVAYIHVVDKYFG